MTDLLQGVLSQLDADRISAMAQRIGATPQQTERAIEAALPLLVGQMARNTAQPGGARALQHALQKDHAQVDLGSLLGSVLGGGQRNDAAGGGLLGSVLGSVLGGGGDAGTPPARGGDALGEGMKILGHIFGARQPRAASGVSQVGGISGGQSSQLMAMLAPIVMAVLARMMQNRSGGADALGGLLGGEARQMQAGGGTGGLLGAVLDRDGDGDVDLSDLMQGGQLLGGLFGRR